MKNQFLFGILPSFLFIICTSSITAQHVPTVEEVHNFFNNQKILISYRDGEVLYGTYYFLEIHYCPSGQYGLYGNSVKKTVLGNEQRNNWQEFGNWKATNQNGIIGLYYSTTKGNQEFVPIYRSINGDLFISEGVSIVRQGIAICY